MSTNEIHRWRHYFLRPFHDLDFGAGGVGDDATGEKMGSYFGEDFLYRQNRCGDDDQFGLSYRVLEIAFSPVNSAQT